MCIPKESGKKDARRSIESVTHTAATHLSSAVHCLGVTAAKSPLLV